MYQNERGKVLIIRYALPNDDGTYDLWQVTANESEGLLLRERMPVDILRNFDLECGKNVLRMGLEGAVKYWVDLDAKQRKNREKAREQQLQWVRREYVPHERSLVAHNVRVLTRVSEDVD